MAGAAELWSETAAITLGLLFFLVGVAHGAGDEQDGTIHPYRLAGAAAYVVTGLAVAALFMSLPLAGLTLFLLLSAWHFAHSTEGQAARKAGFALTAIGGSALWQGGATTQVFAAVLGMDTPPSFILALAGLGATGLALSVWSLARNWRDPVLLSTIVATAALHPVLAVAFAFAAGHALPIQQAQIRRYGWRDVAKAAGLTTVLAVLGALAIAALVVAGNMALPIAAALAFGMATPHMLAERLER
ncbi:Brp/Blh family beta-carotene 15,15'-dioxygenase [Aurantiacibacter sediminis]|uniref:Beta-carotene 15,15'-dioxygenase n=1 Tax=Aurantiacibacter sediminis TaxID=2793064 RepID=A0ABS0N6X7_9SPHN|nr:Brp/Blh family beta-carotene 15,15'-dioxygenase [Aurantiacibacter sediminis]MBH5323522.1 hypothetical protein [Aurantiacibacter sediminis]